MGGLLDALKSPSARRAQRLARGLDPLKSIASSLSRIADALERISPPTTPLLPDSVTVSDTDPKLLAELESVAAMLQQRYGRPPTDDEVFAEHAEVKHLL
jgi:hypothetical protein